MEVSGEGSHVGVGGKQSVFGVKFLDRPGGIIIPAGGFLINFLFLSITFGIDSFSVSIASPDGNVLPAQIVHKIDGAVEVFYTPKIDGQHIITLQRKGGFRLFSIGFLFDSGSS